MKAVDTNVLVRYLVEDDPAQSKKAAAFFDRAVRAGETIHVPDLVLVETVWVLSSCYRVARADVAQTLLRLLRARHLAFAAPDGLQRAADAYASGRGDFADYMIREAAGAAGCDEVVTFDTALLLEAGFARV